MTRRAGAAVLGALVLTSLMALAAPAQTVSPQQDTAFLEGTHAFRRILHDRGFQKFLPTKNSEDLADSKHTLVVILGDTAPLAELFEEPDGLKEFVHNGGALLVATDRRSHDILKRTFGIAVKGERLSLSQDLEGYLGNRECPFLEIRNGEPNLFRSVEVPDGPESPQIATNRPSYLEPISSYNPKELPVLAELPRGCRGSRTYFRRSRPWFAVGGEYGQGRLLLLADHSLFINNMMLRSDNGNFDFAFRCAEWFREGPPTGRDQVLFLEDGNPCTDYDLPVPIALPSPSTLPLLPPEALVPLVNQTLQVLERDNVFDQLLLEAMGGKKNLWMGLAVLLSMALALYGLVRLLQFQYRRDPIVPSFPRLLAKQGPAGPLIEQRSREVLREGNLWEAARTLARHLFESALPEKELACGTQPVVEVPGGWWQRRRWQGQIRSLWQLAHASVPRRVSSRRFAALSADVRRVQAALAAGTLHLRGQATNP